MNRLLEQVKVVAGIAPSVDIYNATPTSDVVSLRDYQTAAFILRQKTAGTNTGTATMTIEACSDASGSNPEAIAFPYAKNEACPADDFGAWLAATTAGFTTTANKDAVYVAEVKGTDLPRGKPFVRAKLTEVVNDPVAGDLIILVTGGQQGDIDTLATAVA